MDPGAREPTVRPISPDACVGTQRLMVKSQIADPFACIQYYIDQ
jgi:hypothetical protein